MSGGPNASLQALQLPLPQPDGSGGRGSFPRQILDVLTGRAAAWLDGEIQQRFGSGYGEAVTTNANGQVRPESQPGTPVAQAKFQDLLQNPLTWVLIAAGGVLAYLLIRKG